MKMITLTKRLPRTRSATTSTESRSTPETADRARLAIERMVSIT